MSSKCAGPAQGDRCNSSFEGRGLNATRPTGASGMACNYGDCALQSRVQVFVSPGARYLIRSGAFAGAQADAALLLTCLDDCYRNGARDPAVALGVDADGNLNNRPDFCDPSGDANDDGDITPADWLYWAKCLSDTTLH